MFPIIDHKLRRLLKNNFHSIVQNKENIPPKLMNRWIFVASIKKKNSHIRQKIADLK